jgi:hypothetical protein
MSPIFISTTPIQNISAWKETEMAIAWISAFVAVGTAARARSSASIKTGN